MQRRNPPNSVLDPSPQEVPSAADPGILSFGTSSSANDERRRSIVSDVEDIDKSSTKIQEFT
jgi:hypothetical protein